MPGEQIIGRLALIPLGFALVILGLELVLQLGALAVWLGGSEVSASWVTEGHRILCLGDSNTHGVWLKQRERDAYPAQLEAVWNDGTRAPVEVLNLGYPGTNSSGLLANYQEMLDVFRPDIVIVMIGVNDFWTQPVPLDIAPPALDLVGFVRRHSRVRRGYYILKGRFDAAELKVETTAAQNGVGGEGLARFGDHEFIFSWEHGPRRGPEAVHELRQNLITLVTLSEKSSTELVLMTYPSRHTLYGLANRTIRATAEAMETRLIDLEAIFRPLCPEEACPDWLYPDQHPKVPGHLRVAETIVQQLSGHAR